MKEEKIKKIIEKEIIENNIELLLKSLKFRINDIDLHLDFDDLSEEEMKEYLKELNHIYQLIQIYENI